MPEEGSESYDYEDPTVNDVLRAFYDQNLISSVITMFASTLASHLRLGAKNATYNDWYRYFLSIAEHIAIPGFYLWVSTYGDLGMPNEDGYYGELASQVLAEFLTPTVLAYFDRAPRQQRIVHAVHDNPVNALDA